MPNDYIADTHGKRGVTANAATLHKMGNMLIWRFMRIIYNVMSFDMFDIFDFVGLSVFGQSPFVVPITE